MSHTLMSACEGRKRRGWEGRRRIGEGGGEEREKKGRREEREEKERDKEREKKGRREERRRGGSERALALDDCLQKGVYLGRDSDYR